VLEVVLMIGPEKANRKARRGVRLKAALRENLKRRKAQARGRAGGEAERAKASPGGERIDADGPDFRRNPGRD
jgi:hypothetical protein